jgi:cytochrome oxidase Cu insertion factor (SCO1/SenC/PrrC family)
MVISAVDLPPVREGRRGAVVSLLALSMLWLAAPPAHAHQADQPPRMDFVLPPPGTYELHRIMRAPDGPVLTVDGRLEKLSRFTRDRITLLGFIYTSCPDPQGCPLAYRVFDRIKEEIRGTPALKDEVQLVTLSFDPARDTPSVMKRYAGRQLEDEGGLRWFFLTTPSVRELMPLVEGFGQDVQYAVDRSTGRPVRQLSHVLKVFLIDRSGYVREIYTSTFLHPRAIIGDVKTLLME